MKNLLYKLFVKYFLPKHKFYVHDILASGMALEVRYRVEARYYNENLKPILIVTDKTGRMFSIEEAGLVRAESEELVETV